MKKIFGWVAASAFVVLGASQDVFAGGWTQLPRSGLGFKTHSSPDRQWGQARLVNNLIGLGQNWNYSHSGHHLDYGDISKYGGGYFPPHQTHRNGTDCDMSMINGAADAQPGLTIYSGWYSRFYTGQLVWWMYQRGGVRVIYFNDRGVGGTTWCTGHDNHLHYGIY